MRHHPTSAGMAIIKKTIVHECGEEVEERELLCTIGGNVFGAATRENSVKVPHKIKTRTTI